MMKLTDFIKGKFTPTEDQETALAALDYFLRGKRPNVFLLKGYAGTGKTTITKYLAGYLKAQNRKFQLMAPTGRAARILKEKTDHGTSTVHKGIYNFLQFHEEVVVKKDGKKKYKFRYKLRETPDDLHNIYIVDEASMISNNYSEGNFFVFGSGHLLSDLIRYTAVRNRNRNDKIIFIGDPAQLPPVGDPISKALCEAHLNEKFNLGVTGCTLTRVVRQSEGSGILDIAGYLRNKLAEKTRQDFNLKTDAHSTLDIHPEDVVDQFLHKNPNLDKESCVIINYTNKSAYEYNLNVRLNRFGPDNPINPGETLIVNQNNYNYKVSIMNGTLVKVLEVGDSEVKNNMPAWDEEGNSCQVSHKFRHLTLAVPHKEGSIRVECKVLENLLCCPEPRLTYEENIALYIDFKIRHPHLKPKSKAFVDALQRDPYFNALKVKYGYAITCHKAQGGEWKSVIVNMDLSQSLLSDNSLRWIYTAVTRAEEHLCLFNKPQITRFSNLTYKDLRLKEGKGPPLQKSEETAEGEPLIFTPPDNLKELQAQFHLTEESQFLKDKFLQVLAQIHGENIEVVERMGRPYQEHYVFRKDRQKAKIIFHYNGKEKFTNLLAAPGPSFSIPLKQSLIKKFNTPRTIHIKGRGQQKKPKAKISFEGKKEKLLPLFERLSKLTVRKNITIEQVLHRSYQEFYYFSRGAEKACLYFFYNGSLQFTHAGPKLKECNANALLADLSTIVKQLKKNNDMSLVKAFELRKQHKFEEAVSLYQVFWEEDPEQLDVWAGWSYAFSLTKLNRYREALAICRKLYRRYPQSEILNSLYARCIYYSQFKKKPLPDLDILKKATHGMFRLSPPHTPYSITSTAIFKLAKHLMSQKQINWQEIEDWLLKMDPDLLDNNTFTVKDNRGKKQEIAGKKEKWYSQMIRVKGGLNKPEELLETLEAARRQEIKWHYNNGIWLARKEAFALQELGRYEEAEKILRRIVSQKKDWFLLFDLSKAVEDPEESFQLMCQAALKPGKTPHKLKLFLSLYRVLKTKDPEWAPSHFCLAALIREENDWPLSSAMEEALDAFEKEGSGDSSRDLFKKLRPYWEEYSGKQASERMQGIIVHILPNRKAGFIKPSSGRQSCFFSVGDLKGEPKVGQKVSFEWIDSFDKKKNKPSKRAVKIRAME